MKKSTKAGVIGIAMLGAAAATGGVAFAGAEDEVEAPITGSALEQASQVALDHTGGGRVTETEIEDEESYYEIEVTFPDGKQTDVQLDKEFNVVGAETDSKNDE